MSEPLGLLLVTMQPPSEMEEEFQDWYDDEHVPERAAIPGFLNARRYVCIEGWPRYVALYDLAHPDVLREPGYLAISGTNFSPWSKRILPRMQGLYRAEGVQISRPCAQIGASGACEWLALMKFRGVPADQGEALVSTVRQAYADKPAVAAARVFRTSYNGEDEFLATIELRRPLGLSQLRIDALEPFASSLDLLNLYARYWRHGRLHGVLSD